MTHKITSLSRGAITMPIFVPPHTMMCGWRGRSYNNKQDNEYDIKMCRKMTWKKEIESNHLPISAAHLIVSMALFFS